MIRTPLIAASLAALTFAASSGIAHAQSAPNNIYVQAHVPARMAPGALLAVQYQAPPAPRYERVPAPRRGMVWSEGHWEWRGHRHVWIPGTWVRVRQGYQYHQPGWAERNGQWYFNNGGWDRDGDGVPNRHDRRPNNPYRN